MASVMTGCTGPHEQHAPQKARASGTGWWDAPRIKGSTLRSNQFRQIGLISSRLIVELVKTHQRVSRRGHTGLSWQIAPGRYRKPLVRQANNIVHMSQ
jgi:hypothetical protein